MHEVVLLGGELLAQDELREGVHGEADLVVRVLGDEGCTYTNISQIKS